MKIYMQYKIQWLTLSICCLMAISCSDRIHSEYYLLNPKQIKKQCEINWLNLKNGICFHYSKDGVLLAKEKYKSNKLDGISYFYCEESSAVLEKIQFRNGELHGQSFGYYCSGKIQYQVKYDNNRLIEVIDLRDESGRSLDSGQHSNGNGVVKKYYKNGTLAAMYEIKNGYKSGIYINYSNTGYADTCYYKKGIRNGEKFPEYLY